jgi:hypothetical protein
MAISIVYGIIISTVLTLLLLPIFLATVNGIKVTVLWFWRSEEWAFWNTEKPTRESVERAVKELSAELGEEEETEEITSAQNHLELE